MDMHYVVDDCVQLDVTAEQAAAAETAGLIYRPEPENPWYWTTPWDVGLQDVEAFLAERDGVEMDPTQNTKNGRPTSWRRWACVLLDGDGVEITRFTSILRRTSETRVRFWWDAIRDHRLRVLPVVQQTVPPHRGLFNARLERLR
jgi:hypothetical protein